MVYITAAYVDRVNLGKWVSLGRLLKKETGWLGDTDLPV